jgi:hypothetical protein
LLDEGPDDYRFLLQQSLAPADVVKSRAVRKQGLGSPIACEQVTINVLEPDIDRTLARLITRCMTERVYHPKTNQNVNAVGKIGKIICEGPLTGQTPSQIIPGFSMWTMKTMCRMTKSLHIPMIPMSTLCELGTSFGENRELTMHVQEVELDTSNKGFNVIPLLMHNRVKIDRWVVRDVRRVGEHFLQQLRTMQPKTQIYALVDRGSDEAARPRGVHQYIAREGAAIQGDHVIYRQFYEDLRCEPNNMYEPFAGFYPFDCD